MKKKTIAFYLILMSLQVLLLCVGVAMIVSGNSGWGIFNVLVNGIGLIVNAKMLQIEMNNYKQWNDSDF
jgi:hypothetical protein